jgi:hypothetical protein
LLWVCVLTGLPHAASAAGAAPCATVRLDGAPGQPALAAAFRQRLEKQGLIREEASCQAWRARLTAGERAAGGLVIELAQPGGRLHRRPLASLDEAAAWVRSMVQSELVAPLLPVTTEPARPSPPPSPPAPPPALVASAPPPASPAPPPPPVLTTSVPAATTAQAAAEPPLVPSLARGSLRGGPTVGVGFDGTVLVGAEVAGCVRLGPTCLGVLGRAWAKVVDTGTELNEETDRVVVHLLALGELWRWPWFRPFFGAGLVWTEQSRSGARDDRGGLRLEGGASLVARLRRATILDCRLFVGIQPTANRALRKINESLLPGDSLGDVGLTVSLRWEP